MSLDKASPLIKSFFAESIKAAMEQARTEMGTEALLLKSREAPPEARHLGPIEVIFAAPPDPGNAAGDASPELSSPSLDASLDELKSELQQIRMLLARSGSAAALGDLGIAREMVEAGCDAAIARSVEDGIRRRLSHQTDSRVIPLRPAPQNLELVRRAASEEFAAHFDASPELSRLSAFVGPPGHGKTTAIVKLAIQHGVSRKRPFCFISCDTHKVGGAAQLQQFAKILGAPFHIAETAESLDKALATQPGDALVFIDTAGFDVARAQKLGPCLSGPLANRQNLDVHLVLTASMRAQDAMKAAEPYAILRPSKLLFTRLDETSSLAAAFCTAVRLKIPISFLSTGQSIPEDIEAATKDRFVSALASQLPSVVPAAA